MTHDTIFALSGLGVLGQACAAAGLAVAVLAVLGSPGALRAVRRALWGYELWAAFAVSVLATAGSLFFSEIANFVPCELCWYQRICLYPLTALTLLMALAGDFRAARYLLPLPVAGAAISVYHLLVENGIVAQSTACLVSAPGGCATKWIEEFGYVTIPGLTLTSFLLLIELLGLAASGDESSEPVRVAYLGAAA